eukprot:TRINITY_DN5239_c0_g1_i1.p2 TRINITY_DN5239_c0_g1~~TRINITY_DN5239_c0_g1_i1.p2  ORF type:complete len:134 (-),score=25.37 TRINITY_DN5239_c0_g1_i1:13-414(-)
MYNNRTVVEDTMKTNLFAVLAGLQVSLQSFQLLGVVLPSKFSTTVQNIESSIQNLTSEQYILAEAQQYAAGMIQQAQQQNAIITQQAIGYQTQLQQQANSRMSIDTQNAKNDAQAIQYYSTKLSALNLSLIHI